MKRWNRLGWVLGCLLMMGAGWMMEGKAACAAGANISIQTDNHTIRSGETFYVVITVTSSEEMSGFEGYFTYNQSVMKYVTGGSVSSGNDDVFSITDTNRENPSTKLKYSIQFKARKSGSSTIQLKSPYHVYRSEDNTNMSVAFNTLNLLIVKKKDAVSGENASGEGNKDSQESAPEKSDHPEKEPGDTGDNLTEKSDDTPENGMTLDGRQPANSGLTLETPAEEGLSGKLPETTSDVFSSENGTLDDSNVPENFAEKTMTQEEKEAQQQKQEEEKKKSSQRLFCILVIMGAATGLIAIGIMLYPVFRRRTDEDVESDGWQEAWSEETLEEDGHSRLPEEKKEADHSDEIPSEQPVESLEEIERRLEQKRLWLDKNR